MALGSLHTLSVDPESGVELELEVWRTIVNRTLSAFAMAGCAALLVASTLTDSKAGVLGDSVTVLNTFEDSVITGGNQTVFGLSDAAVVSDPGVEFPGFIGFYDVDMAPERVTLTLIDNSGATDLLLPEGRFDRYYIEFDTTRIARAAVAGVGSLDAHASVRVLAPGYVFEPADLFGTGLPTSLTFETGAIAIEIGPGADLTELGQQLTIDIIAAPGVVGDSVRVVNSFEDSVITGGQEIVFGASEPVPVDEGDVELPAFIDLYDIDIRSDRLEMTLIDNSIVADLVLPEGRFDRYYIGFDTTTMASAHLVGDGELNDTASIDVLPPGSTVGLVDLFGTGLAESFDFDKGALVVTIGPGTDLSVLGVRLTARLVAANTLEGEVVAIANTFEDATFTSGAESIFDLAGPVAVSSDIEFGSFALYDVDVSGDGVDLTLVDNSIVFDVVLPEGRFDRYYLGFSDPRIASAAVLSADELGAHAEVEILDSSDVPELVDVFGTGIEVPFDVGRSIVRITLGPGTDVSTLGDVLAVGIVPAPLVWDFGGDLTGDGSLNVGDIQCLVAGVLTSAASGGPSPECLAGPTSFLDWNCDGESNIVDIQFSLLANFAALGVQDINNDGYPDLCR